MIHANTVLANRYRIERMIASGGMGDVYEARDANGTPVAIKVLHQRLAANENSARRFAQEIQLARTLQCPYIVSILDSGWDPTAGHFFVMELVHGDDLEVIVNAKGRLSHDFARSVLGQVGAALGIAHAANVVHRDLKPANVLLDRRTNTAKLVDFGVAKVVDAIARASQNSTVIGTPAWMAPEQFSTDDTCSAQSDVWAFGLLAFFILTGKPFWRSHTGQAADTMREICLLPILCASERARELQLSNVLPPAFDAWFSKCVNRSQFERFQNGTTATEALLRDVLPMGKIRLTNPSTPTPPTVNASRPTEPDEPTEKEIQTSIQILRSRLQSALAVASAPPRVVIGVQTPTQGYGSQVPQMPHLTPPQPPVPARATKAITPFVIFLLVVGSIASAIFLAVVLSLLAGH